MSYDIYLKPLEQPPCPTCGHVPDPENSDYSWNYTSNMAGAWDAAGARFRDMNGWTATRVADAIEAAITKIEAEGRDVWAAKWNAPNGWGTVDGMIDRFLAPIARACRNHPDWIVTVSR